MTININSMPNENSHTIYRNVQNVLYTRLHILLLITVLKNFIRHNSNWNGEDTGYTKNLKENRDAGCTCTLYTKRYT